MGEIIVKKYKLAIVEDNPVESRLYKERLGRFDYNITNFQSGEDLLVAVEDGSCYDLILLDQILCNKMSGLMTFEELILVNDQIPVIMITSFGSIKLARIFIKKGGAGFIEKPIDDWEYLDKEIRKVIDATNKDALLKEMKRRTEKLEAEKKLSDSFIGMISHELKTPITVILSNVQVINHINRTTPSINRDLVTYLLTIERYSKKLGATIDSLLEILGMKTSKSGEVATVDLVSVVNSAVLDLKKNFLNNDLNLNCKSDGSCLVEINPDKLFQILLNLIDNANKYSKGEPIDIICQNCTSNDSFAEILVIDNGIGIKEEDCSRIFQQFTRVNASSVDGNGLGLFISKKLVESMGGEIWVNSKMEGGAIFGIRLKKSDNMA